jgi:CheY-like chemotaxis protein
LLTHPLFLPSSFIGALTVRVSHQQHYGKKGTKDAVQNIELHGGEVVELTNLGMVVIEVIDDGVGMTPDQVKTVFQDGTQFNANKFQSGGGSGLGLNIAKGIATEHGGSLKCYSSGMGKGTTFTLSVPMYEKVFDNNNKLVEETAKEDSFSSEVYSERSDFQIADMDILVVDDSTMNRKLCMRLLEKQGHSCKGACDGVEAVQMAQVALEKNEPYDCILLDYEMPNMEGPEACKLIREMGCWSYIVGVTGNVMGEDVARFRECGANWVLPKPFKLEALEQKWIEDGVSPRKQDSEHSGQFLVGLDPELDADTSARLQAGMPSSAVASS